MEQQTIKSYSKRLDYIDLAKGVMILLVIVGHLIQCYSLEAEKEPLHSFIYAFHMPLFFLLSGYVSGLTRERMQLQAFWYWIWGKTKSLLLPYFVWKLLIYPFVDTTYNMGWNYESILHMLFINPKEGGAWFLLSLFCLQVVCYPVLRYEKVWTLFFPTLVMAVGMLLGGSFYYANVYFYASFFAGYYFFKYQGHILISSIATTTVLVFFLAAIIYPNPILLTLTSATALLYICKSTQRKNEMGGGAILLLYDLLIQIGKNTMAIYLLHNLFLIHIDPINTSGYRQTAIFAILLVVSFVVALLCVGVAKIIGYLPVLNMILFGKKTKMVKYC